MAVGCIILDSVARFRSHEARELRSTEATWKWELKMMRGECDAPGRAIMKAMFDRRKYNDYGIETSWVEIPDCDANHIVVALNDRSVAFVWDFASTVIIEFESRMIVFKEGLPRRQIMLLSDIKKERTDFIDQVKLDESIFLEMQSYHDELSAHIVRRSLFQKPPVKQLCAILREEAWNETPQLITYMKEKGNGFKSCLAVDEAFNKIKAKVAKQANTRITPQQAMAVCIDSGLLSKLNHFKEVDYQEIMPVRAAHNSLPSNTFAARIFFVLLNQRSGLF